jgi:hypothetical protein
MSSFVKMTVKELNSVLTCGLCFGYFQDAHTIPECMHTFCRSCITQYFQRGNAGPLCCPTCNAEVGLFHVAVSKIVFDRNIQSIVDKLFPLDGSGIQIQPKKERTHLEFMVRVFPDDTCAEALRLPSIPKPAFRGKSDVKVSKIQRFIHARFTEDYQKTINAEAIDVLLNGMSLDEKSDLSSGESCVLYDEGNPVLTLKYRLKRK